MLSSQATNQARDGALVNAKVSCYLGLASAKSGHLPDAGDIFTTECGDANGHYASVDGRSVVSNPRDPLKITNSVVCLDVANVVDFWKTAGVWNEGYGYKPMNRYHPNKMTGVKKDLNVPSITDIQTKFSSLSFPESVSLCFTETVETSYFTKSADFVEASESRNSYRVPEFSLIHETIHSTMPQDSQYKGGISACSPL